jgi:diguanylate cyclase (GGDEF)-like protein
LKRRNIYWSLIVLLTALPVILDINFREGLARLSTFIWSLFLVPNILIMIMYPKWKTLIWAAVFFSILKYTIEFSEGVPNDKKELIILISGSFVNGAVLLTVGYFGIRYAKLLLEVQKLTLTDTLTGLYNRRYFDFYMEKAIPLSYRSSLVLIMVDIDHFKKLNDQYGHQCGDVALKHFSAILRKSVRKSDGYVRFGGEEFAIILPNTDLDEGQTFAERMRTAVENSISFYQNKPIHFTISIGVALHGDESVEEFIENADKALYRAKENGRNRVEIFS